MVRYSINVLKYTQMKLFEKLKRRKADKAYKKGCEEEELKFEKAKKEADRRLRVTGKRHYIVPTETDLMIVNNDWLKAYNKEIKRRKMKSMSHLELTKLAYYSTGQGDLRI